jgi:hypothetical protein
MDHAADHIGKYNQFVPQVSFQQHQRSVNACKIAHPCPHSPPAPPLPLLLLHLLLSSPRLLSHTLL